MSKLGLDFEKVKMAKSYAARIASDVQGFVEDYTTIAVERTLCRLLGIDGVDPNDVPLPNIVTDHLKDKGVLDQGVLFFLGNAIAETGLDPQELADKISANEIDIIKLPIHPKAEIDSALNQYITTALERIRNNRIRREEFIKNKGEGAKTIHLCDCCNWKYI